MKSFSQRTKETLCRLEIGKGCCVVAELVGFILFAGKLEEGKIRIATENETVMERFSEIFKRCFSAETNVEKGKNTLFCIIDDERILKRIYDDFCDKAGDGYVVGDSVVKKECCRGAFLRGAFLGGGTVVDPNKNYNMEFITPSRELCIKTDRILKEMSLGFSKTVRRRNCVLYVKSSEIICDALTYMGAFGAQMEILNIKIERELRNDLNRVANSETANFDKVVKAAVLQIKAIEKIERTIGLDGLPEELRETALLRVKNKDLSLDELGKRMCPPLTKSGVNHRLKKIAEIADKIEEKPKDCF